MTSRSRWLEGVCAVGVVATAAAFALAPARALGGYLVAYCFAWTLSSASLILAAIFQATGARWPLPLRPWLLALGVGGALLALLFLPIAIGVRSLYTWATPEALPHELRAWAEHVHGYLNLPFFAVRGIAYGLISLVASMLLVRRPSSKGAGAAVILIVALTTTFASFDWLMSLTPRWYSTIFSVYVWSGATVAALAIAILAALSSGTANGWQLNAARLLFAFVCFWAYAAYSQIMLQWIADLPEEVVWYLPRMRGPWGVLGWILIIGHFAFPFALLLSRRAKEHRPTLRFACAWLLVMHFVDLYWIAMPSVGSGAFRPHWVDLTSAAALIGALVAGALWILRRRAALVGLVGALP
jgi:hypothetical protein